MADSETEQEKLDRRWQDQLQELRVMQTGAQLTAGFLLTLPFQQKFSELSRFDQVLYVALVLLAGLTVLIVVTPVAAHRRLEGDHAKALVVATGTVCLRGAMACLTGLITGMVGLIVHVVLGTPEAIVGAAGIFVVALGLFFVVPQVLARRDR